MFQTSNAPRIGNAALQLAGDVTVCVLVDSIPKWWQMAHLFTGKKRARDLDHLTFPEERQFSVTFARDLCAGYTLANLFFLNFPERSLSHNRRA